MLGKISDILYVGNWQDARNVSYDNTPFNIMTVAFDSPWIGHLQWKLVDGPAEGNEHLFHLAIENLKEFQDEKKLTLVHCVSGQSRSCAVVAGYLMKSRNITYEQALEIIKAAKADVAIKPFFEEILRKGI
jgi:protein-tyrosine phosphatase